MKTYNKPQVAVISINPGCLMEGSLKISETGHTSNWTREKQTGKQGFGQGMWEDMK